VGQVSIQVVEEIGAADLFVEDKADHLGVDDSGVDDSLADDMLVTVLHSNVVVEADDTELIHQRLAHIGALGQDHRGWSHIAAAGVQLD
jgi:hypothetical protein